MATLLDSIFAPEQACEGHISISQVLTYLRCPESYRRKYILGEKEPPSVALVEGGAHHRALERANNHKADVGADLAVEDHVALFSDTFTDATVEADEELAWAEDETPDGILARGRKLIEAYHASISPRLVPKDVEGRINAEIAGTPLLGYADVIAGLDGDDAPVILDYKTAKRAKTANDLANDLQLAIYARALGIERVAFVSLCKTKTPKVELLTGVIPPEQQASAVRVVEGVVAAINAGVFPPTDPGSWICSAKFCGHWERCRGCAGTV